MTEISYNYEEQPYRAEIEFISSTDWEKELKVLFQDLLDGSGQISRDCTNEDTDGKRSLLVLATLFQVIRVRNPRKYDYASPSSVRHSRGCQTLVILY